MLCAGHVILSAGASISFERIVPANALIRRSIRAYRRRLQGTTVDLVPSVTLCRSSAVVTCYWNDCSPSLTFGHLQHSRLQLDRP